MSTTARITEPNTCAIFELPSENPRRPVWQVILNEDGSLTVIAMGRSPTKMLVCPRSDQSVSITNARILSS